MDHQDEISITMEEASISMEASFTSAADSIYDKVSRAIFYALAFLMPVWFLPVTPFPLEANKAYLAYFLVIAAFISWLIGRVKASSLRVPKSALLASFGLLVLVWGITAIFSQSPHFSFMALGYDTGTFTVMLLVAVSAFLVALLFQDASFVSRWIMFLFVSAIVVFLFQLLHLVFGFSFGVPEIFSAPTSNLVGGWNSFGVFAGLIAFLSLSFLEIIKLPRIKSLLIVLLVVSFLALALVNFAALWWILAVLLIIFLSYLFILRKGTLSFLSPTLWAIFLILFFILAEQLAASLVAYTGISFLEVRPSWGATLDVVKNALSEHLLVGSGPNTFLYDWLKYRPVGLNATLFWNVRFVAGVGHVVSWAAGTGILGIFALLALFASLLWHGYKSIAKMENSGEHHLLIIVLLTSVYLWLANIFYTPSFALVFFTFVFSGMFVALGVRLGVIRTFNLAILQNSASGFISVMLLIFTMIFSVSSIYYVAQKYLALWSFGSGLTAYTVANDLDRAENYILRAVRYDDRDQYLRTLTEISLVRMQQVLARKDLSSNELMSQFQGILSNAINYGQSAIQANPIDPLNWMSLGRVYEAVIPFKVSGASEAANSMYDAAAARNPANPEILLAKARVAIQSSKTEDAKNFLNQAIALKSDYTPARFLLVQLAVAAGDSREAIVQAEAASVLDPNDLGVLFQLGLLYYQGNRMNDAKVIFERAASLNPDYANVLYFLGLVYDRLGNTDKAIEQFEHVLKLNPGHAEVAKILSNLRAGKAALSNISPPGPAPEKRGTPPVE